MNFGIASDHIGVCPNVRMQRVKLIKYRKELVENKKLFNQIIQEQNKIDKRINKIEGIWFIRVWRKIAQIWHKNS